MRQAHGDMLVVQKGRGGAVNDNPLTDDEHHARAMLMGMCYHHGNGDPIYYKVDENGQEYVDSFIDANTLEPLYRNRTTAEAPWLDARGRRVHDLMIKERIRKLNDQWVWKADEYYGRQKTDP